MRLGRLPPSDKTVLWQTSNGPVRLEFYSTDSIGGTWCSIYGSEVEVEMPIYGILPYNWFNYTYPPEPYHFPDSEWDFIEDSWWSFILMFDPFKRCARLEYESKKLERGATIKWLRR